jgi:hypothetical protein
LVERMLRWISPFPYLKAAIWTYSGEALSCQSH